MQENTTKTQRIRQFATTLTRFFSTRSFYIAVMVFFVVSSTYVAVVSLYPMAFDEEVHYGLIQAYSESVNPFALQQLPEYDKYGSVVTDPSYLFHYLMSFPYRMLSAVFSSDTPIIIGLRLINVAFFAAALVIFRRLLLEARVSRGVTHVVLAVMVLVPIVPLVAGQVNYDNLLLLVCAGLFLTAWRVHEQLRAQSDQVGRTLVYVALLAFYGSVVKYAIIPILLAVFLYVVFELVLAARRDGIKSLYQTVARGLQRVSITTKVVLLIALIVGVGLFAQRYVLNAVQYGSPVPKCDAVMSVERCRDFGPYRRDDNYRKSNENREVRSLPHYTATHFAWGMWHRLYFTIAGPTNYHSNYRHLPIMSNTAVAIVALGALAFIVQARSLLRRYPAFWLFIATSVLYVAILLMQLYNTYATTGIPAAINGRYLLLILPLAGAIGATAIIELMRRLKIDYLAGVFTLAVLLLLLQGGGPISYIISADAAWFWNEPAAQVNALLDTVLSPLIHGR